MGYYPDFSSVDVKLNTNKTISVSFKPCDLSCRVASYMLYMNGDNGNDLQIGSIAADPDVQYSILTVTSYVDGHKFAPQERFSLYIAGFSADTLTMHTSNLVYVTLPTPGLPIIGDFRLGFEVKEWNSIYVGWVNVPNVVRYEIFIGNQTFSFSEDDNTNNVTVANLSNGDYPFGLIAYNAAGGYRRAEQPVVNGYPVYFVTISGYSPTPSPPSNIIISAPSQIGGGVYSISWTTTQVNAVSYDVWAMRIGGAWYKKPLTVLNGRSSQFVVDSVGQYSVKVIGTNKWGSKESNIVTFTVTKNDVFQWTPSENIAFLNHGATTALSAIRFNSYIDNLIAYVATRGGGTNISVASQISNNTIKVGKVVTCKELLVACKARNIKGGNISAEVINSINVVINQYLRPSSGISVLSVGDEVLGAYFITFGSVFL